MEPSLVYQSNKLISIFFVSDYNTLPSTCACMCINEVDDLCLIKEVFEINAVMRINSKFHCKAFLQPINARSNHIMSYLCSLHKLDRSEMCVESQSMMKTKEVFPCPVTGRCFCLLSPSFCFNTTPLYSNKTVDKS